MLSQRTSPNMDQKPLRPHQRQQSIPIHYEVHHHLPQNFPASHQSHPAMLHQRGISCDQPATPQQHYPMGSPQMEQEAYNRQQVGITNPGQQRQQHYTQVAQQHAQARPGLSEHNRTPSHDSHASQRRELEEMKSLLQRERQERQRLEQERNTFLFGQYNAGMAEKMERSRSDQGPYMATVPEYGMMVMPNGLLAPSNAQTTEQVRRPSTSGGDATSFEGASSQQYQWQHQMQRATTPDNRSPDCTTPMTPAASPFVIARPLVMAQRPASPRQIDDMDTDATIKASRSPTKQRSLASVFVPIQSTESQDSKPPSNTQARPTLPQGFSNPDLFGAQATESSNEWLISPPNTAPLRHSRHFDVGVAPVTMLPIHQQSQSHQIRHQTQSCHGSTTSSPVMAQIKQDPGSSQYHFAGDVAPMFPAQADHVQFSPSQGERGSIQYRDASPSEHSSHSRGMSLASLDLDAIVQDTGISDQEVQAYISAPDQDGKWTCLYPGCHKVHGRKENVRAHVQTHLNDRQYLCIHCNKSFVRPHDLKRHSKVHTGVKPYPCDCGHVFARHDALTRHRQRNICSGGIGGVIKKTAKRGRPKKARPEDDERANKAAKTRKRVAVKGEAQSVSGTSGSSQAASSRDCSPEAFMLELAEYQPAKAESYDASTFDLASFTRGGSESLFHTPPMSPRDSVNPQSPEEALSVYSGRSPSAMDNQSTYHSPQLPVQHSPSVHPSEATSHYGSAMSSPPELSHSSPPASASMPDFDFQDLINSSETCDNQAATTMERSPSFEDFYASSPEELVNDDSWKNDSYFNFNDRSDTGDFTDNKYTFSDEILFSDGAEMRDDFF